MTDRPPISQDLWDTIPPAAQAAVLALVGVLEQRIATLEEKANKNSTNSSKERDENNFRIFREYDIMISSPWIGAQQRIGALHGRPCTENRTDDEAPVQLA